MTSAKFHYFVSGASATSAVICAMCGDARFTLLNAAFAGVNWIIGEQREAGRE